MLGISYCCFRTLPGLQIDSVSGAIFSFFPQPFTLVLRCDAVSEVAHGSVLSTYVRARSLTQ